MLQRKYVVNPNIFKHDTPSFQKDNLAKAIPETLREYIYPSFKRSQGEDATKKSKANAYK